MTSFYHFQVWFMITFIFVLRVGTVYFIHFRHNLAPIQNLYSDLTSFKSWQNSMLQIMIDFSFETSKIIAYANVRFIVSSVFKAVHVSIALPWCSSWYCADIIVLEFVRLVIRTHVMHMQIGMVPLLDYVALNHCLLQNDICIAELAHRSG